MMINNPTFRAKKKTSGSTRARSNKAKGRNAQQEVRDFLLAAAPFLEEDDIKSTSMGAPGEDILLSPYARKSYPWAIEVKHKKSIAACRFMEQAQSHAAKTDYHAVAFFREDHGPWYVCVEADYLLELIKRQGT